MIGTAQVMTVLTKPPTELYGLCRKDVRHCVASTRLTSLDQIALFISSDKLWRLGGKYDTLINLRGSLGSSPTVGSADMAAVSSCIGLNLK